MGNLLFLPPIAFILFFLLYLGISALSKGLAAKGNAAEGKEKAYACGQTTDINKIQPNYREFFPFAFFFTIMHVVVLVIATMPAEAMWHALLYIAIAVLALRILFRR